VGNEIGLKNLISCSQTESLDHLRVYLRIYRTPILFMNYSLEITLYKTQKME